MVKRRLSIIKSNKTNYLAEMTIESSSELPSSAATTTTEIIKEPVYTYFLVFFLIKTFYFLLF